MTIQYHSDAHSISEVAVTWLLSHGKYKCVLSHPIPWDVSHGIPIGMTYGQACVFDICTKSQSLCK